MSQVQVGMGGVEHCRSREGRGLKPLHRPEARAGVATWNYSVGQPVLNSPLHQKPEKKLGARTRRGSLGVYVLFGPSPLKSSSLKDGETNEKGQGTGLPAVS